MGEWIETVGGVGSETGSVFSNEEFKKTKQKSTTGIGARTHPGLHR